VFMVLQSLVTCAGTITYFIPTLMTALDYKGRMAQYVRTSCIWRSLITYLSLFESDDDPYLYELHLPVNLNILTAATEMQIPRPLSSSLPAASHPTCKRKDLVTSCSWLPCPRLP
jgi:hypothetical protein